MGGVIDLPEELTIAHGLEGLRCPSLLPAIYLPCPLSKRTAVSACMILAVEAILG